MPLEPGAPNQDPSALTPAGTPRPLIAAGRVRGARVYGQDGAAIGRIHDVLINKRTGRVALVLLRLGGFAAWGRRLWAASWSQLSYDPQRRGCASDIRRQDLDPIPNFRPEALSGAAERREAREADLFTAALLARRSGGPA